MKRIYVLDALRCVLALSVAIGHAGVFPLFGSVGQQDAVLDLLARGFRTLVFGPPAVIAFFVISGFCIHYPFAATRSPCPVMPFYARRYIRILVPVACTVMLFKLLFPGAAIVGVDSILWHSTLWSVLCEEIYYAFYPALNRIAPRVGWWPLILAAFALSAAAIWYGYPGVEWQDIGIVATALTLFPVWLLGCHLAEEIPVLPTELSTRDIWLWRLVAWVVMWISLMLHFHSALHQTLTGVPVGIAYYFWIRAEIIYHRRRMPWATLVWAGRWSYSLYLIHPIVVGACLQFGILSFGSRTGWLIGVALILLGSYVFYLLVEWPSHSFAKRIPLLRRDALTENAVAGTT